MEYGSGGEDNSSSSSAMEFGLGLYLISESVLTCLSSLASV